MLYSDSNQYRHSHPDPSGRFCDPDCDGGPFGHAFSHTDRWTYSHRPDAHALSHPHPQPFGHAHLVLRPDPHRPDAHAHSNRLTESFADSYRNMDWDKRAYPNTHPYRFTFTHFYPNRHAFTDPYFNQHADCHAQSRLPAGNRPNSHQRSEYRNESA